MTSKPTSARVPRKTPGKIRRMISIALVAILVLLFALTYLNSTRAEAQFTSRITALARAVEPVARVELSDYQRGLFVSRATTRVRLFDRSLTLEHRLRHFAWGLTVTTTPAEAEAVSLVSRINPFAVTATLSMPDLDLSGANGRVRITGAKLSVETDPEGRNGTLRGQLEQLRLIAAGSQTLLLEELALEGRLGDASAPGGALNCGIARAVLQRPAASDLSARDLLLDFAGGVSTGAAHASVELLVGTLATTTGTAGPGRLHLALEDLPADQLEKLRSRLEPLAAPGLLRDTDSLEFQLQLLGLYAVLLEVNGRLELEELSLETGAGRLQGQGSLTLLEAGNRSGLAALVERLSAEFRLYAPEDSWAAVYRLAAGLRQPPAATPDSAALSAEARRLAQRLVERGILMRVAGEGGYRMDLELAAGRLYVNEPAPEE